MGGGLVLFGIGGASRGGLVDAFTERGSGRRQRLEALRASSERAALARTQAEPAGRRRWAELARARVQLAAIGDNYDPNTDKSLAGGQREARRPRRRPGTATSRSAEARPTTASPA